MFLSFLMDIFVNSVNLALQSKEVNVLHYYEKLKAFSIELSLWHSKLVQKNFCSFPNLNEILDENKLQMSDNILKVMKWYIFDPNSVNNAIFQNYDNLINFIVLLTFSLDSNQTICLQLTIKFKNSL